MRRAVATVVLAAACAAALLGLPAPAAHASDPAPAGRALDPTQRQVVLVLATYLDWSQLSPASTPTLWKLADEGAIGALNARTRSRERGSAPSPLDGALSISSGSWAQHVSESPGAFSAAEHYEVGTAAEAYERTTGSQLPEGGIAFLGLPGTQRANDTRSYTVILGTLGEAVAQQGGLVAAIGNSDVGYVTAQQRRIRPAALAAMDTSGVVPVGDVSSRLLADEPFAPFGLRTDFAEFERSLDQVAERTRTAQGPSLVVLDPGDLYRAMKFRPQVTDQVHERNNLEALEALDHTAALARERFPRATIIVASLSTGDPAQGDDEGLGPIIVSDGSLTGYLTSDGTQRQGVVTILDLTAGVLDQLAVKSPVQVMGSALRADGSTDSLLQRVKRLSTLSAKAVAVDSAKAGVVNFFVGLTVLTLLLAAFALVRFTSWSIPVRKWVVGALKASLLLAMSLPIAGWLMFTWMPLPTSSLQAVLGLAVTSAAVWLVALVIWRFTPTRVPVGVMSLATALTICVDQWLGAPASFTNFFGYSPLLAARFYGMGNEAAAMVFGATIVGLSLLFDQWPDSAKTRFAKRFVLPVVGAVVTATAAAPFWGANVGVAIWGVVGFALGWVLMNGGHVSWRVVFWLFLAVVLIIGGFAAIDLFGGGEQTHLSRALTSAEQGGLIELWTIIARKAETNMRVLTHTNWAYILVATLAFLGFMRWRPQGDFAATLTDNPDFADAITVSLIAGLVAYFTEDSGIVIPALEVFYVGVALSWLMLARVWPGNPGDGSVRDLGAGTEGAHTP